MRRSLFAVALASLLLILTAASAHAQGRLDDPRLAGVQTVADWRPAPAGPSAAT